MAIEGEKFRFRAHEVSRIEAFSDVIFGFALSLLAVSLEAPRTYEELMEMMRGLLPFAICFFIFIQLWFEHHNYFKRYALHDGTTLGLNTVLLFVVLGYVYPLKFMFTLFVSGLSGVSHHLTHEQVIWLFTIYGAGFALIFGLLAAMFVHAYNRRAELQLNAFEVLATEESAWDNATMALGGVLSIITVFIAPHWAGMIYFGLVIPKTLVPTIFGRRRRKLLAAETRRTNTP
jgi:uncharacterized membrane protein